MIEYSNLTIYVSGGMSDQPNFNFDLFDEVAAYGRSCGYRMLSPAENDRNVWPAMVEAPGFAKGFIAEHLRPPEHALKHLFAWDLWAIGEADAIVLLPGWEKSSGAAVEIDLAKLFGKQIWYAVRTGRPVEDGWYFQPTDPKAPAASTIIGLCGYAQSGKDTVAQMLVDFHGFERIAFADALRDMLYALNPITVVDQDELNWQTIDTLRLHDIIGRHGWDSAKQTIPEVRELLQRLGTEAGRQVLGDDIWVRTALAKIKPGHKYVISDVRFPNEADAIYGLAGQLWRVVRSGTEPVNAHVSETALDSRGTDAIIRNHGSLEQLLAHVEDIYACAVAV